MSILQVLELRKRKQLTVRGVFIRYDWVAPVDQMDDKSQQHRPGSWSPNDQISLQMKKKMKWGELVEEDQDPAVINVIRWIIMRLEAPPPTQIIDADRCYWIILSSRSCPACWFTASNCFFSLLFRRETKAEMNHRQTQTDRKPKKKKKKKWDMVECSSDSDHFKCDESCSKQVWNRIRNIFRNIFEKELKYCL